MTQQRRVVMEELERLGSHPTADELYDTVRRRAPSISKGTVYRNLQILGEQGSVRTIESSSGQRHYDHNTHEHYHVQCTECGRVADVVLKSVKIDGLTRAKACGFNVTGHNLELFGVCPECGQKAGGRK